ncbi:DUF421 domain-containing protein [Mycolicibacterium sp. 3033]|nr:DUF421 domain-containing protein [Mycolicibacterium aurantiacum]
MSHEIFDGWQHPAFAAVKALALFITAAAAFRFGQRRTLAEFTPFDWVAAVAVGAIVGRTSTAADTSFVSGAAALLTLIAAHGLVSRLRFFDGIRRLVDPPVRVLISNGQLDHRNMRRAGITRADIDAILRQHGLRDPSEVDLALFEAKGSVSVFSRRKA